MARRLIITAGWLAAAVLAVLVGLVGVGVIRDGITAPITRPLSQAEVERELARIPPSPSAAAPSPVREGPAPKAFATRGGTVVARCVDGAAEVVSLSPAPGFLVHDDDEFRGVTDNHDRVKFDLSCNGDTPEMSEDD